MLNEIVRINMGDELYPKYATNIMGRKAPKYLEVIGNVKLLKEIAVGIVGARNSSDNGIKITKEITKDICHSGLVIVSGNATGVDIAAHETALIEHSPTIFVLPEGIGHFQIRQQLNEIWNWDKVLVVSQFEQHDKWENYRAMDRNLMILALVRALVVVEAGETGGSLHIGKEAIRRDIPLFIPDNHASVDTSVAGHTSVVGHAKGNGMLRKMGANELGAKEVIKAAKMEYNPRQKELM